MIDKEQFTDMFPEFAAAYRDIVADGSGCDYIINFGQASKFSNAYKYLRHAAELNNGSIGEVHMTPSLEHGGLVFSFRSLDLSGDMLAGFIEMLGDITAISIDPLPKGGIEVSLTIPNVFIKH